MKSQKTVHHHKETRRTNLVAFKLNDDEMRRLKANGLLADTHVSKLIRARLADLIGGDAVVPLASPVNQKAV